MSYLHRPGLTFSGRFEANVATGNNEPRFYTDPPTPPPPADTNWNVMGGGEFRLLNCVVGAVQLLAGEFAPAGFRDLSRGHVRYVSVLDDVIWAPPGASEFVDRLRAATDDGLLAIRLTTHSYNFGTRIGRLEGAV